MNNFTAGESVAYYHGETYMNRDIFLSKTQRFINRKYFIIFYFAVCFAVPFLIYWNLFSTNQIFSAGDGLGFYSSRIFFANSLKSGEFTLWNPYLSNGVPFAEDNNGIFYPVQLLLSLLPPRLFVYSYYSFHLALGATFMYLYIKEIGYGKIAAFCTSAVYLMSIHLAGYRKTHISIITCIVFLPVILYFIERYIRSKKICHLIISAICMSLQFLNAHTQLALYSDILVFVYLLVMQLRNKFKIRKIIRDVLIWGSLYVGMICVQLLPVLNIMREYKKSGSAETSYDTFCSWSIHPIKLIMMLFPEIFGKGNIMEPIGTGYSSELDIEIFLGVVVFMLILFAAIFYIKDFRVRLSLAFMAISFGYCVQAHIPLLSKLLYKIPVINGFRVSSRALFIFIFFAYVLLAFSLSKLREKEAFDKLRRFVNWFSAVIFSVLGLTLFILLTNIVLSNGDYISLFSYYRSAFSKTLLTVLSAVIFLNLLNFIMKKDKRVPYKSIYAVMAMAILTVTIAETYQYSTMNYTADATVLSASSSIETQIHQDIGDSKVLLALNRMDVGYASILQFNMNCIADIPAINSYSAFNNPRLFSLFTDKSIMLPSYNYSGLLSGFLDAKNNLYLQNDLLSMLGVKYIIDPLNLVDANGGIIELTGEGKTILDIPEIKIAGQSGADISVFLSQPVSLEKNTYYKVSYDAIADSDKPSALRLDFQGTDYDSADQDKSISAATKIRTNSFIINSEDTSVAADSGIALRIYGTSETNILITNLKVIKMETTYQPNVYKLYTVDGTTNIYENTNVLGILNAPEYLKSIDSTEDIYNNVLEYSLDDTSYIENYKERDISQVNTTIEIMSHTNNGISAKVTADGDTFINFSQNYFPGWKAYVDGKETRIYMVNGLIQGIEVPAGEHTITFRYFPTSLLIGGGITVFTLTAAVMMIIVEKRKEKTTRIKDN